MQKESILLQAPSKIGKTTELYFFMEYLATLYPPGKFKVRVVSGDSGGTDPFYDSGAVESGIADVLELSNDGMLVDTMDKITKGYWPDKNGNLKLQESCKTIDKENVKAYFFEGITAFSELLKHHMTQNVVVDRNNVTMAGFKAAAVWEEGDSITAALGQSQIGQGQNKVVSWLVNSLSILKTTGVEWLVWTSHEDTRFNSKTGGETILPCISFGNAENSKLSQKFQNHFRLSILPITGENGVVEDTRVLYWKKHTDPISEATALCGVRLLPSWIPQFEKWYPEGYVKCNLGEPGKAGGMVDFFRKKDAMRKFHLKKMEEKRQKG